MTRTAALRAGVLIVMAAVLAVACASDGADRPESALAPLTVAPATTAGREDGPAAPTTTVSTQDTAAGGVTDGEPADDAGGDAPPDTSAPTVRPTGFPLVGVRVIDADGAVCDVCMWAADSNERRGRGLMGVTDLGGAAGMVFVYTEPRSGPFFMFQTPTPLDIHWVGADGVAIVSAAMDPCLDVDSSQCPRYRPGVDYLLAVETFRGGAADIGLAVGSTVELISAEDVCDEVLAGIATS